jgi:hypothetical protein
MTLPGMIITAGPDVTTRVAARCFFEGSDGRAQRW